MDNVCTESQERTGFTATRKKTIEQIPTRSGAPKTDFCGAFPFAPMEFAPSALRKQRDGDRCLRPQILCSNGLDLPALLNGPEPPVKSIPEAFFPQRKPLGASDRKWRDTPGVAQGPGSLDLSDFCQLQTPIGEYPLVGNKHIRAISIEHARMQRLIGQFPNTGWLPARHAQTPAPCVCRRCERPARACPQAPSRRLWSIRQHWREIAKVAKSQGRHGTTDRVFHFPGQIVNPISGHTVHIPRGQRQ